MSLTVLLGGFFWLRSIDNNPDDRASANNDTREEREGEYREERSEAARSSGQTPTSSAYQTDEEVRGCGFMGPPSQLGVVYVISMRTSSQLFLRPKVQSS